MAPSRHSAGRQGGRRSWSLSSNESIDSDEHLQVEDPPPRDSLSEVLRSPKNQAKDRRSLSSLLSLDGDDNSTLVSEEEEPKFSCFGKEDSREILRAGWKYAEAQMAVELKKATHQQTLKLMAHQSEQKYQICTKIDERADQQEEQNDRLEKKLDRVYESNQKILENQERDERRRQRMERAGGTRRKLGFDDEATPGPKAKKRKVEGAMATKSREERIAARKAKADRDHCERNARTRGRA